LRVVIATAVLLVLAGCSHRGQKASQPDVKTTARIDRCTQRFLDRAKGNNRAQLRSYVETSYCGPFARKGFVYADGTLSIKAHLFLLKGLSCSTVVVSPGRRSKTIPCDPQTSELDPLECGILHNVRRDEVRAYIQKLERTRSVKCDDGTPLDKLGAT
jgi:hypothetical protein